VLSNTLVEILPGEIGPEPKEKLISTVGTVSKRKIAMRLSKGRADFFRSAFFAKAASY